MRHVVLIALVGGCAGSPEGLLRTPEGDGPTVVVDFEAQPLPELPFPNDLATRPDPGSPTGLRVNLPVTTDLDFERKVRLGVNELDGFGIFAPITVRFDAGIDVGELFARQLDDAFDPDGFADDAVYLIDVDPDSPEFGQPVFLDFDHGRFPSDSNELGHYLPNDPRRDEPSLMFETGEEDLDGDGVLDPGEDTDDDGILDHPNVWPPGGDHRLDLLTSYDLQSNTLFLRPVTPLRERTRYAVVLTSALVDEGGQPVRSPWDWVNHTRQTDALEPVVGALEDLGRSRDDIAFAWTFTTGSITTGLWDLTEGVRGRGPQGWLREAIPPQVTEAAKLHTTDLDDPWRLPVSMVVDPLTDIGLFPDYAVDTMRDAYSSFTDVVVGGAFLSPDLLYDGDDGGKDDSDEHFRYDPVTGHVKTGVRRITFTCAIPKASNGKGPPWPIAIHMHGYGSTRVELFGFAWAQNREGMVVCGIDAPGQGVALSDAEEDVVGGLLYLTDTRPLWWHILDDRIRDLDNDGLGDPAGDMLTADPFHTRDMLRQGIVDAAQLMEALRRCGEGEMEKTEATETDLIHTGAMVTSCDWDGDGKADIGGPDTEFRLDGVSQGGIMTSLSIAVNEAPVAVTTVPGGGLLDVGLRTDIGGVSDAVVGRALSPLLIGRPQPDGSVAVSQVVISVDEQRELPIGTLPSWPHGGSVVVRNLTIGREESGGFRDDGSFRVPIGANAPDAIEKRAVVDMPDIPTIGAIYSAPDNEGLGDRLELEVLDARGDRVALFDTFATDVLHEGVTMPAGSPLIAGSWGLGLRRGSHDLQRIVTVQGMAIEPGDPIAYARRWWQEPFAEPKHVLVHLTAGDSSVPEATGIALARAAGIVDFRTIDERYGTTPDRFLIDHGVVHGYEQSWPYRNANGSAILFDPDDLDEGLDGSGAPSETPLRITVPRDGGVDALRILYVNPTGQHAYYLPNDTVPFDWDTFAVQQMARYLSTVGTDLTDDLCQETRECPWLRPFEVDGP
ncbi:MAG: hypothetical protein H6738_00315 [Alphaproteobacteria bacterium]|nr:hypothetical protein [Alphaproteobacteria bacterium]